MLEFGVDDIFNKREIWCVLLPLENSFRDRSLQPILRTLVIVFVVDNAVRPAVRWPQSIRTRRENARIHSAVWLMRMVGDGDGCDNMPLRWDIQVGKVRLMIR